MQSKPFRLGISLLLLGIVIILAVILLLLVRDSEFGGADGAAEEAITEVAPGYTPWFTPLLEPPGGETESLLFALQAALGAGLIGNGMGAGAAAVVWTGAACRRGVSRAFCARRCGEHRPGTAIASVHVAVRAVVVRHSS